MLHIKTDLDSPDASLLPNTFISLDAREDLQHVARSLAKAKRVAVVCGAGISCAAGIPDFRSSEGLFKTLKDQNPQAKLTSGKDLFSTSLFQSEANISLYYSMIAALCDLSANAEPTAFHRLLKLLDDNNKLSRVYTQNIDGLEKKAGLTFGLGDRVTQPLSLSPSKKRKHVDVESTEPASPTKGTPISTPQSTPTKQRRARPDIPRVIPLHGSLHTLSCSKCHQSEPLLDNQKHRDTLAKGQAVACSACLDAREIRSATNERQRGVGVMKPDVVLYGESHAGADTVGAITEKDLMGARPDLLLVCGTSLKVPGTKRLVRELAKVTNPTTMAAATVELPGINTSPAYRAKTVFLNLDFPTQAKEWTSLFDVWIQGDIQEFASVASAECTLRLAEEAKFLARKQSFTRSSPRASPNPSPARKALDKLQLSPTKPKGPPAKPGWDYVLIEDTNVFQAAPILLGKRHRKTTSKFSLAESVSDDAGHSRQEIDLQGSEVVPPFVIEIPSSIASSSAASPAVTLVSTPSDSTPLFEDTKTADVLNPPTAECEDPFTNSSLVVLVPTHVKLAAL